MYTIKHNKKEIKMNNIIMAGISVMTTIKFIELINFIISLDWTFLLV